MALVPPQFKMSGALLLRQSRSSVDMAEERQESVHKTDIYDDGRSCPGFKTVVDLDSGYTFTYKEQYFRRVSRHISMLLRAQGLFIAEPASPFRGVPGIRLGVEGCTTVINLLLDSAVPSGSMG